MGEQSEKTGPGVVAGVALLAGLIAALTTGTPGAAEARDALDGPPVDRDDFRCGQSSPLLDRLGDAYLDLESPIIDFEQAHGIERLSTSHASRNQDDIDADDAARLVKLLDSLPSAGLTDGSGYRIQCRGSGDGTPDAVLWRFDLEQIELIDTLATYPLITAFENRFDVIAPTDDRLVDNVLVAEVMTLPDSPEWYLGADGRTLRSTGRARRRAGLIEIDWTFAPASDDLEIAQTFYTNGRASERAVWRLSR